MLKVKELRAKASTIATQMKAIVDKAKAEDRGITGEEETTWNNLRADYEATSASIERLEDLEKRGKFADDAAKLFSPGQGADEGRQLPGGGQEGESRTMFAGKSIRSRYFEGRGIATRNDDPELAEAFDALLRFGPGVLTPEHRALINARREVRGTNPQAVGTDSLGGYTVPEGFSGQLEVAMKAFGGIRSVALVINTSTGGLIPWPTINDTGTSGSLLAENTTDTVSDMTFGEVQLTAYKYTSGIVKVSKELLQDSAFDLASVLGRLMGERLGRVTATAYAQGTGTGQPQGISKATAGKTLSHKLLASLTYAELLDLKHSVDPAYRQGAKWVFNDNVFKQVKLLKDDTGGAGSGRPLWQPNIADAVPATLDGDRYVIDLGMPDFGSSTRPAVYGDMSKFIIRDSLGFDMVVLRERYAEFHQVGFIVIMRTDSRLLDAGTNPIKALVCSA